MPANPKLYISVDDYQESSRVKHLIEHLEDDQIEEYIIEAMIIIDARIGPGWNPSDDTQEFIFPRDIDVEDDRLTEPWIPRPIVTATRLIVDDIIKKEATGVLPHEIQSETNHAHSYSKFESSKSDRSFGDISPRALALLESFINSGGHFAVA